MFDAVNPLMHGLVGQPGRPRHIADGKEPRHIGRSMAVGDHMAAIDRQAIPPTLNLDSPDERCRLDHVPHVARPHPVTVTASNSFGFGGANLCLVIRRAA
jgi:hypothetical protein